MPISKGSQYMMLSVFFNALVGLTVKLLSHVPAIEIVLGLSLLSLVANYVTLRYHQISIWGHNPRLLAARGLTSTLGVVFYFITIQGLPLPSALVLRYTAPIFTALMGVLMLQETVRVQQWCFFGLSFLGIVLINGFVLEETSWYVLLGLGSAVLKGLANGLIRKIEHEEHPQVVTFYGYLAGLPLIGMCYLQQPVALQGQDLLLLGCASLLGYLAHYNTVKAFQLGPIAPISAISYLAVVYALLFNYLFLNEALSWMKLLGIALVLLGVLLNVSYKYKGVPQKR